MRALAIVLLVGCGARSGFGYLEPPPSTEHRLGLGAIDYHLASTLERKYLTEPVPPPVSLVPTDGSELVLKRLSANVTIAGPLAHTELHFTFHNAENRQREGRFALTLPASAAVTAFKMKVNGQWREARVVARQRGREIYESYLHRKVDPALLEQDAGNTPSASPARCCSSRGRIPTSSAARTCARTSSRRSRSTSPPTTSSETRRR